MAAAAVSPSMIDLKSQATLPIRLGASILDKSASHASRLMSVRYNHRPHLRHSNTVEAIISESGEIGLSKLSLESEDGKYAYLGGHEEDDGSYVLLARGQGKDKELVLERVHGSHTFNLTETPSEHNAATLAAQHPHIPVDLADQDDLFGDGDEDEPLDDSNPFDYRHFLKAELEKPENTNPSLDATRSAAGTPLIQHHAGNTPLRKPVKPAAKVQPPKKRKTATVAKPNPKRVKAGEEEPSAPSAGTAKAKLKAEVPKVVLDRKASLRRSSTVDDTGELILENETPATEKPPKHNAMSLALSGQLGEGPRSLMSAASTPGEGMSANTHEPEEVMETYEFELGDSSPEHEQDDGDLVVEEEEEEKVDHGIHGGEDDDDDVDPMELPSPAQGRSRPSVSAAAGNVGGDEVDDDDFEQQIAAAMLEGDGSEESEEE